MFEKSEMLYLYVETPLHAGSGGSVGVVDLPIQRERVTHYPLVQASGLKGKLRAEAYEWDTFVKRKDAIKATLTKRPDETDEGFKRRSENEARKQAAKALGLEAVFGPEGDGAHEHAGALSPGDARLLLFPVRSLVGVFAWTTSRNVLARFKRDLEAAKQPVSWTLDNLPDNGKAWTVDDKSVVASGKVVLEEFAFDAQQHDDVKTIAKWLAENAMSTSGEYTYFKDKLYKQDGANVTGSFVILPEDAFRDFTQFGTEVITRIRIDQETKTAAGKALWSEEHLPSDTVLYAPLHASRPRVKKDELPSGWTGTVDEVINFVKGLKLDRIQLGGDETVGRGIVKLRFESPTTTVATKATPEGEQL